MTKPKGADVIVKFRGAEPQRDFDRADVARLRQDVRDAQQAERLMVANAVPRHVHRAVFAIENFRRARDALIERRRQRDQLERRPRLIQRSHRAVHTCFRWCFAGGVGIELRPIRQREDLAAVRIYHHHAAGDGVRLGDGRAELSFGDVLDSFIQRKNHVRAAFALRFAAVKPALPRVGHHDDLFALAADLAVQLVFDSTQALLIEIDEAQHMRRQVALRVEPLIFLLEINPF